MSRRPEGVCPLCLRKRPLCRSHIIPESIYKTGNIIDPEYGYALETKRGRDAVRKTQTGFWQHLLCEDCEGRLNVYDNYFQDVWFSDAGLPERPRPGRLLIQGLDYQKFRLFHLSVLWRASVAKKVSAFNTLKLPVAYEKALRAMLWADAADLYGDFEFIGTCLTDEGKVFPAVSDGQLLGPIPGCLTYGIMYAGVVWTFFVGRIPPVVYGDALQRNGTMPLLVEDMDHYFRLQRTKRRGGGK